VHAHTIKHTIIHKHTHTHTHTPTSLQLQTQTIINNVQSFTQQIISVTMHSHQHSHIMIMVKHNQECLMLW